MNTITLLQNMKRHRAVLTIACSIVVLVLASISTSAAWPWLRITTSLIFIGIVGGFVAIVYCDMSRRTATITLESSMDLQRQAPSTTEIEELHPVESPIIPPMPTTAPMVPAPKRWKLAHTKRLFTITAACLIILSISPAFMLRLNQIIVMFVGLLFIVVIYELTNYGIRRLHRIWALRVENRRPYRDDEMVVEPPAQEYFYYRRPHVTMFINHIALQIILWIVVLVGGIVFLHNGLHAPLWMNILVQAWVSLINSYFIVRAYLLWSGMIYCVSKKDFTIQRTEDLFFWMRRSTATKDKGRLVGKEIDHRSITEFFFFRNRRKFILELQGDEPVMKIPYVGDFREFFAALNA